MTTEGGFEEEKEKEAEAEAELEKEQMVRGGMYEGVFVKEVVDTTTRGEIVCCLFGKYKHYKGMRIFCVIYILYTLACMCAHTHTHTHAHCRSWLLLLLVRSTTLTLLWEFIMTTDWRLTFELRQQIAKYL